MVHRKNLGRFNDSLTQMPKMIGGARVRGCRAEEEAGYPKPINLKKTSFKKS